MFVNAIRHVAEFTRPILFLTRYYGSKEIRPGLATLFFVNADGWALTCRHVLNEIVAEQPIANRRAAFENDLATVKGKVSHGLRKKIEVKHGLNSSQAFEHKVEFGFATSGQVTFSWQLHPTCDVALIRFHNFTDAWCGTFPTFASNGTDLQPGKTNRM